MLAHADVVAVYVEQAHIGLQSLAHEKFKCPRGRFQLAALALHLFDALQQLGSQSIVEALSERVVLQRIRDVRPAGQVAHQYPTLISDRFWRNMLVCGGVPEDGADVYSSLVGKRAASHEWLIVAQRAVGHIRDEPADRSETAQLVRANG